MDETEKVLTRFFAFRGLLFRNRFDVPLWLQEQLIKGYNVELEHGSKIDSRLDVSEDRADVTVKIALVHLLEAPDYYDRLERMEREAEAYWQQQSGEMEERKRALDGLIERIK